MNTEPLGLTDELRLLADRLGVHEANVIRRAAHRLDAVEREAARLVRVVVDLEGQVTRAQRAQRGEGMNRPTCKTCPYWAPQAELEAMDAAWCEDDNGVYELAHGDGECRRHAPQGPPSFHIATPTTATDQTMWAETKWNDWCGEHPQFGEYIASLKSP